MSGHGSRLPRRALLGALLLDLGVSPLFAWNVFEADLRQQVHTGETALAAVFSLALASFTVGVLVGGRAADTIAPRRLAFMTALGTTVGLVGAGTARSLEMLIAAFGVALGASTGLGYATAVRVAGSVTHRRGTALSLVVSAYAAGTIAIAPVAAWLLGATSLRWAFVVLASAVGAMLICAAVLLEGVVPAARIARRRNHLPVGRVVELWLIFALGSAPALTAFAHARALSGQLDSAALSLSMLSAGNLLGRLIAGPAADRLGLQPALHATAVSLVASCAALAVAENATAISAGLLGLGFEYGALSALVPAAAANAVPSDRFGFAYGIVFTAWGAAGLVTPVAAGAIATKTTWSVPFLVFAGLGVVTSLIIAGRGVSTGPGTKA